MHDQKISKNPLLGCLEIAIFMREGPQRFTQGKEAMWRSFLIAALNIPLLLISMPYVYAAKENLHASPLSLITILFIIKIIVVMIVGLGLIYYFCHLTKRKENFVYYITVANWSALIGMVVFIPIILLLHFGIKSYEDLYPAIIILGVYSYAYATFVLKHALKIPWELSIFLMVCLMAINETTFDVIYALARQKMLFFNGL